MKFTINVEATPDEAREFIGLPDVKGMQDRFMADMEKRMSDSIKDLDPETFTRTWMPMAMQGWNDMQKTFWGQMGMGMPMAGMTGGDDEEDKKNKS